MSQQITPGCCESAIGFMEWREPSELYGPEKAAWSIGFDSQIYGDTSYVGISFCPFCGAKLEPVSSVASKSEEATG